MRPQKESCQMTSLRLLMKKNRDLYLFGLKTSTLIGLYIFILLASPSFSNKNNFDSIYFETAVNISAKDISKAIHVADSLYQHSTSEIHRVKALMLSSSLFQQKGDLKRSIHYAEKADQLAVKHQLYDWEARIAGFLSTQFRIMGLYEEGEIYLEKGKNVSLKIENQQMKVLYLGMIYQETAYYEIEYERYNNAYKNAVEAEKNFKKIEDELNRNYFLATNEELLGRICIGLKKWEDATKHYNSALEKLSKVTQENAMLSGFIYSGLGRVYLEKRNLSVSIENLSKAEKIVDQADYLELKIEVYKALADYYQFSKDYANYSIYNDKYIESLKLSEKKKKESISSFVSSTKSQKNRLTNNRNILLIVSITLLVVIILIFLWHRKTRKSDFERFKLLMARMRENQQRKEQEIEEKEEEQQDEKEPDRKRIMSDSVEIKILNDLDEFEKGTKYTEKQISLPILAGILSTNTKYLSYVLKTHKQKDFNSYINELRISYIIEKIKNNSTFRNYKLSALAEECGFSSHSKFSAVFKSITGLSPSSFLEYIQKNE